MPRSPALRIWGVIAGYADEARIRRELIYAVTAGATVAVARHPAPRYASAGLLLMGLAAYALLTRGPMAVRQPALFVCGAAAIAATLLVPNGFGPAPFLLAVVHCRTTFRGRSGELVTGIFAVAFAGTIAWITHSYVGLLAGLGVPALAGRRLEQAELKVERDRAVRLVAELQAAQDAEAQAAALRERGRIARDMHDVLAHTLSGLSLQLQAVRAVAAREGVGPAVTEPLDRAAELARSGVEEAKAVVGTLRSAPLVDALGVDQVPLLVQRFPGDARLSVDGEPGWLDPASSHAVYRAVQESLTNAARYAPHAPVSVALAWSGPELRVTVSDPGSDVAAPSGQGSGSGLTGMRERVEAAGGRLSYGRVGRGWRTELSVPVAGSSA